MVFDIAPAGTDTAEEDVEEIRLEKEPHLPKERFPLLTEICSRRIT